MKKLLMVVGLAVCMAGIAGAELLSNPDFEEDGGSFSGWSEWGGGSGSGETVPWWGLGDNWVNVMKDGTAQSGDTYMEHGIWNDVEDVQGTGWWWAWGVSLLFQNMPVHTGDTYTISAWVRDGWSDCSDNTVPAMLTFEQRFDDGTGGWTDRPPEVDLDGDGNNDRINVEFDIPKDGQWHYISATHTIPEGVNWITAVFSTAYFNNNLHMDNLSLKSNRAHNPTPANGDTAALTLDTLAWDNPDPNNPGDTITCDVYWSDTHSEDPNFTNNAVKIAEGVTGTSVALGELANPITLEFGKMYSWRVNCLDSGSDEVVGHIWNFTVGNTAPVVEVDDVYTWLIGGSSTIILDVTAEDDGHPEPASLSYEWAVTSGDEATIAITDSQAEDAEVVITATGEYELEVIVGDGELSTTETVLVSVSETACEATKAGGELPASDINGDCSVDMADLALLAANWMGCMSFDCP